MATSVRLDEAFVAESKIRAAASHRSLPKEIEYSALVGQIAIDNPDLSYAFIQEALQAKAEMDEGAVTRYERKTKKT